MEKILQSSKSIESFYLYDKFNSDMANYRMTFGRNDLPDTTEMNFKARTDKAAIKRFGAERRKSRHRWDALQILDRIDRPEKIIPEKTTRIITV